MCDECCHGAGRDESCCDSNVIDAVARIRESVATAEDGPLRDRDITTLTIFVGELAQAIVQYDDPEVGMESSE
jgi:hypothetical protein